MTIIPVDHQFAGAGVYIIADGCKALKNAPTVDLSSTIVFNDYTPFIGSNVAWTTFTTTTGMPGSAVGRSEPVFAKAGM